MKTYLIMVLSLFCVLPLQAMRVNGRHKNGASGNSGFSRVAAQYGPSITQRQEGYQRSAKALVAEYDRLSDSAKPGAAQAITTYTGLSVDSLRGLVGTGSHSSDNRRATAYTQELVKDEYALAKEQAQANAGERRRLARRTSAEVAKDEAREAAIRKRDMEIAAVEAETQAILARQRMGEKTVDVGAELTASLQTLKSGNETQRVEARETIKTLFYYLQHLYAAPENRIVPIQGSEFAALRAASEQARREMAEAENQAARETMLGDFIDAFEHGDDSEREEATNSLFDFLEGAIPVEQRHVQKSEQEKKGAWRDAKAEAARKWDDERMLAISRRAVEREREGAEKAVRDWNDRWAQLHAELQRAEADLQEKRDRVDQATDIYREGLIRDVSGANADRLQSERGADKDAIVRAERILKEKQAAFAAHEAKRPPQPAVRSSDVERLRNQDGARRRVESGNLAKPKTVGDQPPNAEIMNAQVFAKCAVEQNHEVITNREWWDRKRAQAQKGAVIKQTIEDKTSLAKTLKDMYQDLLSAKAFEAAERYKSQVEAAELEVARAIVEGEKHLEEMDALDALRPREEATEMVKY